MKPGDFLLSVLDFFAILLPGSLATWLATQYIPTAFITQALTFGLQGAGTPNQTAVVAAFLLSSYMLGHFVFMIGAQLDGPYERWMKRAKPEAQDTTFKAAQKLQRTLTKNIAGGFTVLKWSKAYIQAQAPLARHEIDRLEADSKFFRSLVVVWMAFAAHFMLRVQSPVATIAALLLAALSYHRFKEQRWKLTELSYGTAVIVSATKATGKTETVATASSSEED